MMICSRQGSLSGSGSLTYCKGERTVFEAHTLHGSTSWQAMREPLSVLHPRPAERPRWIRRPRRARGRSALHRAPRSRPRTQPAARRPPPAAADAPHPSAPALQRIVGFMTAKTRVLVLRLLQHPYSIPPVFTVLPTSPPV